ncbi:hypothetical protein VP395_10465 [Mariniflexile soesokkakense]|uniref:Uncharacterized protein n=1 Tax=Mariniflexile soesokkakense TaxID=1343160 RepID=A0ABV0AAY9_9FLAO
MKRTVLLLAGLLIGLTTVSATNLNNNNNENGIVKRYRYAQPIVFVERGVEFLIFPDGSFDFNTNINGVYNGSNSRRSSINASYNGPRISVNYSSSQPKGTYISRDRNGTIRSIGDVYLNYDRYGKVTRIGSVFVDYSRGRNATLAQVGGLRVNYNHYGEIVNIYGQINRYNTNCNVCGTLSCTVNHKHKKGHNDCDRDDDRYDNDDNYYYYKQNGKEKKYKKYKR